MLELGIVNTGCFFEKGHGDTFLFLGLSFGEDSDGLNGMHNPNTD